MDEFVEANINANMRDFITFSPEENEIAEFQTVTRHFLAMLELTGGVGRQDRLVVIAKGVARELGAIKARLPL